MRLGVVSNGTLLLSVTAGDDPELSAIDLPALNPDVNALGRTISANRAHIAAILRERYNIHLLGIYAYPAQVIFAENHFADLTTSPVDEYELHPWRSRSSLQASAVYL